MYFLERALCCPRAALVPAPAPLHNSCLKIEWKLTVDFYHICFLIIVLPAVLKFLEFCDLKVLFLVDFLVKHLRMAAHS